MAGGAGPVEYLEVTGGAERGASSRASSVFISTPRSRQCRLTVNRPASVAGVSASVVAAGSVFETAAFSVACTSRRTRRSRRSRSRHSWRARRIRAGQLLRGERVGERTARTGRRLERRGYERGHPGRCVGDPEHGGGADVAPLDGDGREPLTGLV